MTFAATLECADTRGTASAATLQCAVASAATLECTVAIRQPPWSVRWPQLDAHDITCAAVEVVGVHKVKTRHGDTLLLLWHRLLCGGSLQLVTSLFDLILSQQ